MSNLFSPMAKLISSGGLLGWGTHVGKITGVLEYLESLDSSKDNELVLMMDAYGKLKTSASA